ncbi:hypothetical protein Pcinc_001534 [Petrolisthes cinctipes]|uniref:Uncharacterized protein n=1 Tax=Petrolisthes cinctipes TaxID=88211 RepID=A0AAE1GR81_PETCI|nr:hypothetical protein Pcinc_001534 [Petrolisthes cinctipes]
MGRQSFFPQGYGIACPSGAGYREHFDILLERMVEAGLVEKWKTDEILTLNRRRHSSPSTGEIVRKGPGAITITHLQGAFFIYVIGGGLALLVLMIEGCANGRKA